MPWCATPSPSFSHVAILTPRSETIAAAHGHRTHPAGQRMAAIIADRRGIAAWSRGIAHGPKGACPSPARSSARPRHAPFVYGGRAHLVRGENPQSDELLDCDLQRAVFAGHRVGHRAVADPGSSCRSGYCPAHVCRIFALRSTGLLTAYTCHEGAQNLADSIGLVARNGRAMLEPRARRGL